MEVLESGEVRAALAFVTSAESGTASTPAGYGGSVRATALAAKVEGGALRIAKNRL